MKQTPMMRITSIVVAFTLLFINSATAQPAPAQAEHLFREGKRLMKEGNIAEACSAFEASYVKDPAVSTLLNLADCREKNHQYASAWGHFIDAARLTRGKSDQTTFHKTATDRAAGVENRLSYLIINVPADTHIEGLTITVDRKPLAETEWNRKFPVDEGEYKVEGKAPAHEPWSTTVSVAAAKDTKSVTVPRFQASSRAETTLLTNESMNQPVPWHADRLGWILVSGGVVGTLAGGGLLLSGASLYNQAADEDRQAVANDLERQGDTRMLIGGITGGLGVALLASGVIKLALTDDRRPAPPLRVTIRPSSFSISGSF